MEALPHLVGRLGPRAIAVRGAISRVVASCESMAWRPIRATRIGHRRTALDAVSRSEVGLVLLLRAVSWHLG